MHHAYIASLRLYLRVRLTVDGGCRQPREEVLPAAHVVDYFGVRKSEVRDFDLGAAVSGVEDDLDCAGARRKAVGTGMAPGEQQSVRGIDLEIFASYRYTFDIDGERSAWGWLQTSVLA